MSAEGARAADADISEEVFEQEATELTEVAQAEEAKTGEQKETKGAKADEKIVELPEISEEERARVGRAEHPAGEVFFRGNVEEVTESEAEEIARRQLARSGLLRGQKVRVED